MESEPLTEADLDFINETLMKYGNDDSILDVSELDGFLTAIVSGPNMIPPSHWFPELWGGAGNEPEWESEAEFQRFMSLVFQHMNHNISMLMESPDEFEALFAVSKTEEGDVFVAEEWCFGYMRGVDLGGWPQLSGEVCAWLDTITLHGREENFSVLEGMTLEEHQRSVSEIEPAVSKLHAYWLAQRSKPQPVATSPKIGRNEPCPCGSGKKYKRCCLH